MHQQAMRNNPSRRHSAPRSNRGQHNHKCHWPGCQQRLQKGWACPAHWQRLPVALKERIRKTYRPGQERDKQPSQAYIEAAQEVHFWLLENPGVVYT